MRSRKNFPTFVAYAVISALVLGFMATQMGGEFFFDRGYRVAAVFATGSQLVSGDEVDVNGLRVGKVEWVSPEQTGARVGMVIHSQYAPIFGDAHAVIKGRNLLGETYVELNRGKPAAAPMPDGGTIAKENTLTPVEIDQVLDTLDQGTRDRLTLLINSLGGALAGRGGDLNQQGADLKVLAQSLSTIAHTLATSQAHLDSLITSLTKVLQTLAAWHTQFRALIADWDQLMQTLAAHEQDLQGFFVNQDRVLAVFDQALAGGNAQDLHNALAEAPDSLDSVNRYLDQSNLVFPAIAQRTGDISALFYELASVMSGTDGAGHHAWRVYQVGGCTSVSLPTPNLCPKLGGVPGQLPGGGLPVPTGGR